MPSDHDARGRSACACLGERAVGNAAAADRARGARAACARRRRACTQPPAAARPRTPHFRPSAAASLQWRSQRVNSLTSDSGWLTLTGLFWLKAGDNSFGRALLQLAHLDNPALADTAGSFVLTGQQVRFVARPGSGVTHDGQPVTALDLAPDASGAPHGARERRAALLRHRARRQARRARARSEQPAPPPASAASSTFRSAPTG